MKLVKSIDFWLIITLATTAAALVILCGCAHADVATHNLPSELRQRQVWNGDLVAGYSPNGCTSGTSASLSHSIASCEAYVKDTTTNENIYRGVAGSTTITYPANQTCWTIVSAQSTIGGWTRVANGSFFFICQGTKPSTPNQSLMTMQVITNGTAITTATSLVNRLTFPVQSVLDVTGPPYNVVCGTVSGAVATTNLAAIQQAITDAEGGDKQIVLLTCATVQISTKLILANISKAKLMSLGNTILQSQDPAAPVINVLSCPYATIEGIRVDYTSNANASVYAIDISESFLFFRHGGGPADSSRILHAMRATAVTSVNYLEMADITFGLLQQIRGDGITALGYAVVADKVGYLGKHQAAGTRGWLIEDHTLLWCNRCYAYLFDVNYSLTAGAPFVGDPQRVSLINSVSEAAGCVGIRVVYQPEVKISGGTVFSNGQQTAGTCNGLGLNRYSIDLLVVYNATVESMDIYDSKADGGIHTSGTGTSQARILGNTIRDGLGKCVHSEATVQNTIIVGNTCYNMDAGIDIPATTGLGNLVLNADKVTDATNISISNGINFLGGHTLIWDAVNTEFAFNGQVSFAGVSTFAVGTIGGIRAIFFDSSTASGLGYTPAGSILSMGVLNTTYIQMSPANGTQFIQLTGGGQVSACLTAAGKLVRGTPGC